MQQERDKNDDDHAGIPRDEKGDPIFFILPPAALEGYGQKLALCEAAWRQGEPLAVAEAATLAHLYRQPIPAWLEQAIVTLAMERRSGRQAKLHAEARIHFERYEAVVNFKKGALVQEADNTLRQLPPMSWEKAYAAAAETLAGTTMAGDAETMKSSYCRVQRDLNAKRSGRYFTLKDWRYCINGRPNPKGPSKPPTEH